MSKKKQRAVRTDLADWGQEKATREDYREAIFAACMINKIFSAVHEIIESHERLNGRHRAMIRDFVRRSVELWNSSSGLMPRRVRGLAGSRVDELEELDREIN